MVTMEQGRHQETHISVLDLFCGPGGLSEGIMSARNKGFRFRVDVANDHDSSVRETYRANHRAVSFVFGSITDEATKEEVVLAVRQKTGRPKVDVVVGGPPCKGFSLENKMTRNMDNPSNHLVDHYTEMIRRIKPMAFIMENVPGLLAINGGNVKKRLLDRFRAMGYNNATDWLLNAADYGVPQLRKRAFLVGSMSDMPIDKPKRTHDRYVTLDEAIGDLPEIRPGRATPDKDMYSAKPANGFQRDMRGALRRVTNHVVTVNKPIVVKRMETVPPGRNWSVIPEKLMKVDGKYKNIGQTHSMIYKRLPAGKPSVTITNFRKAMMIHPRQHRLLSVREAARIQTFPDRFRFMGGISSQQQQVSDAVPVGLAKAVGEAMLEHLHGAFGKEMAAWQNSLLDGVQTASDR